MKGYFTQSNYINNHTCTILNWQEEYSKMLFCFLPTEMSASEVSQFAAIRHFRALAFTHKNGGNNLKSFLQYFYYAECCILPGSSAWHNEQITEIHIYIHFIFACMLLTARLAVR